MTKEVRLYYFITCGHHFLKVSLCHIPRNLSHILTHIHPSLHVPSKAYSNVHLCSEKNLRWLNHSYRRKVLPRWFHGKESTCQCRRLGGFDPWVERIPWSRKWQPTLVFLPGKSHGQRILKGYGLQCHRESDRTEHACWSEKYTPNTSKEACVHVQLLSRVRLCNSMECSLPGKPN